MKNPPQARRTGPLHTNLVRTHSPSRIRGVAGARRTVTAGCWGRGAAATLRSGRAYSVAGPAGKERGRGLGASSILGPRRRDVLCSGGSRQDGVCGKLRGSSAGRDSVRAVPSGTVGLDGVVEGRGMSSRKLSRRGGEHLHARTRPPPSPSCAPVLI